jgi:P27 family predicted phage terminase small subunit
MPGTAQSGGNRQKTRRQHELDGTFRKDRHAELSSPEPPSGRPDTPSELCSVGQAEWDRMMTRLEESQSLFRVDDAAIYQYCRLYAETESVAEHKATLEASVARLEENLPDFKGEDFVKLVMELGQMMKLIAKCTDQARSGRMAIRQYLVEFGLTPSSRGRIKLPAKKESADEFTAFQRKRVVA